MWKLIILMYKIQKISLISPISFKDKGRNFGYSKQDLIFLLCPLCIAFILRYHTKCFLLIFYFAKLIFAKVKIHTLFGRIGSGRAIIFFASGNNLCILNTLYSITSIRNLLNFKDIHRRNHHIDIFSERNIEFICLIIKISSKKYVIKKDIGFTLQVLFYNHKNN